MSNGVNEAFELHGVSHVALVCKDMARTVGFYRDVLGLPLIKTIEMRNGYGQQFFFDVGNGDALAFFWFQGAPDGMPGLTTPAGFPIEGDMVTAHGSMNHIALKVSPEHFDIHVERLRAKGVAISSVINYDDTPWQVSRDPNDRVYGRSVYFFDPDGICVEFCAWTRAFRPDDVAHDPARADGTRAIGMVTADAQPATAAPVPVPAE